MRVHRTTPAAAAARSGRTRRPAGPARRPAPARRPPSRRRCRAGAPAARAATAGPRPSPRPARRPRRSPSPRSRQFADGALEDGPGFLAVLGAPLAVEAGLAQLVAEGVGVRLVELHA